jgi:glycosyltransferase involved in cell wall biosynthesis
MSLQIPLVSIYITNYNYAAFIRQSIESALKQTLQDFELLIIDDGSKDNSKEIIETYRDNPKVSIIYQQNKGLNVTNNIAMRAAQGRYIMRLDADDFLVPDALEKMVAVLEKDDALGLIFPDYYYVDKEGNITGEEKRHNFEREVSLYDQPAHGACTMIRLDFLKQIGGYNESFTCQDGYDLWIKFITHYKVTNINQPLFYYRRHGSNLTTNEERILDTRKKIKQLFVNQYLSVPKTVGIIPVRRQLISGFFWPLFEINGKSILRRKVETCVASQNLSEIVVSTSDSEVVEHCNQWIEEYDNVRLIIRPEAFEKQNESLNSTIVKVLGVLGNNAEVYDAVMTISLEFPLMTADIIDDTVNTLALFKSDSVLTVRPDNKMYYQHTGQTLKPIVEQEKFTKLEREAIYKAVGGIALGKTSNVVNYGTLISSKVGHVVVSEKAGFSVNNDFEFDIFRALSENKRFKKLYFQ